MAAGAVALAIADKVRIIGQGKASLKKKWAINKPMKTNKDPPSDSVIAVIIIRFPAP